MAPKTLHAVLAVGLVGSTLPGAFAGDCEKHTLDFIVLEGDPLMALIEDDIVSDLAQVGITVNTRFLAKDPFNTAMQAGDFHLCFSETWGPPYDPHAFATGWFQPNQEAHYPAMAQMEPPMTRDTMENLVTAVLSVEDLATRQSEWEDILLEMHRQAISNPMWSRRVPAIWNKRLSGYTPGYQQYDYPVHNFVVNSGSTTITVAPGAQTGLFTSTGDMDPHSYRPNEFFISNWMYEGLVSYGANGQILPALAVEWTVAPTSSGGEEYRFVLRTGVKFHDGADWDCAAAKMNFDHVLHPALTTSDYHGWYHLPLHTTGWSCDGETFVVTVDAPYYPFLQELSYIRPLRMLSPQSFFAGPTSDKTTQNSCPARWATVTAGSDSVTCKGIQGLAGTGPWKYGSTSTRSDGTISEVFFDRNDDWWGQRGNVQTVKVVQFDSSDAVKAALDDGTLDVAVGDKVLTPEQAHDFEQSGTHITAQGPPILNQIVVMNAAKTPTSSLHLRKVIMHAVDKAAIVTSELHGQAEVADSLFPKDAPYCDVDLTPRWDYDLEKATMMNCPESDDDDDLALILGLTLGLGIPLVIGIGVFAYCVGKSAGYKQFQDGKQQGAKSPPSVIGNGEPPVAQA